MVIQKMHNNIFYINLQIGEEAIQFDQSTTNHQPDSKNDPPSKFEEFELAHTSFGPLHQMQEIDKDTDELFLDM